MAESYRGLTIKIGGNTTGLQQALKAVNSAIRATDSEARKLKQALKLDESNVSAAKLQVGAVAEQANNAAYRMRTLKTAMQQVGAEKIDGKTVEEFANKTHTAALDAELAKEAYVGVNAELEKYYNIAREGANDKSLFRDPADFEKDLAVYQEYMEQVDKSKMYTDEQVESMRHLKSVWDEYSQSLKDANTVQAFVDLTAEEAKAEAQAESLARQYVELGSAVERTDMADKVDLLKVAAEEAKARFDALDKAAQLDPSNVELMRKRQEALNDATATSEKYMDALKDRISELSKETGVDRVTEDTATLKLRLNESEKAAVELARKLSDAESAVKELNKEYNDKRAKDPLYEKSEAAQELREKIENAENAVKELRAESDKANNTVKTDKMCLEQREYQDELEQSTAKTKNLASQSNSSFSSITTTFTLVAEKIRQKYDQIITKAREAAVSIDSAFRDMAKTVEASDAELEELKQGAIDFSKTHVTTAEQLLEIEAMGGQMGIAVDKLEEFAEIASSLDIATDIDAEEISQNMGQLINIMDDLDVDNLQGFADGLVTIGNNLPATESQTMQTAMRIAAQANILGMTTDKVLGWSAALAASGQNPEAAGTALSRTMAQIELAVGSGTDSMSKFEEITGVAANALRDLWNSDQEAAVSKVEELIYSNADALDYFAALTGQTAEEFRYAFEEDAAEGALDLIASIGEAEDKLDSFAAIAGLTGEQFAAIWKEDASAAMQLFVEGLGKIDDSGESVEATLNGLGITAVRQKQAIENLVKTSDVLSDALEMTGDAVDGVSGRFDAYGAATREAEKKSEGISGKYEIMQNSINALATELGEGLLPHIENFTKLVNWAADALDGWGVGGKSAIITIGGIASALAVAGPLINTVTSNWGSLVEGFTDFTSAHPVITAVIALGVAVAGLAVDLADVHERHQRYSDALAGYARSCDVFADSVDSTNETFREQLNAVKDANDEMDTYFKGIIDMYDGFRDANKEIVNTSDYLEDAYENLNKFVGTKIDPDQLTEIQTYADILNNALGTEITVYQDENGIARLWDGATQAVMDNTDAIYENIKALEYKMVAEATAARSQSLLEQMQTDAEAVAEAYEAMQKAQDALNSKKNYHDELDALGPMGVLIAEAHNEATGYNEALKELTEAQENYSAAMQQQTQTTDDYNAAMEQMRVLEKGASMSAGEYAAYVDDLQYRLISAGISQKEWAKAVDECGITLEGVARICDDLSSEQLQALIDGFDGSSESLQNGYALITDSLNYMSDEWKQSVARLTGTSDESSDAWKDAWEAIKQAFADGKITAGGYLGEIKSSAEDTKQGLDELEEPEIININTDDLSRADRVIRDYKEKWATAVNIPVTYSVNKNIPASSETTLNPLGFATGYIKHAKGFVNNPQYIKHAAGILTKPTDITRYVRDQGGEAGAESLIPLTKPNVGLFGKPLADLVAERLGSYNANSTVNVYIGEKLLASSPYLSDAIWDVLAEVDRLGGGNVR